MKKEELKEFELIPINELTIRLDPTLTMGYDLTVQDNFTFSTYDGIFVQDSMAVYIPIDKGAEEDIDTKIGVWNNLLSQTDIQLVTKPTQDIILGIYSIT